MMNILQNEPVMQEKSSVSLRNRLFALGLSTVAFMSFAQDAKPVQTASGLIYQSITEGSGTSPTARDSVRVHYRGTLADGGREFDSSYKRGVPAEFPLSRVIPCWTEGVQLMKPGGKARLTCPPSIAYGQRGAGNAVPPNATLVFEVELLSVKR